MDAIISLQDVATLVLFVAPGYFAIQVYSLIYAKRDRDFSRLVVESVVYSLPIVALTDILWSTLGLPPVTMPRTSYVALLMGVAIAVGLGTAYLRMLGPVRRVLAKIGLHSADEDFVKTQLLRIDVSDPRHNLIIIKLKNGQIFSGTVDRLSRYSHDGPKYYYFTNIAWLNEASSRWQARPGGVIVERAEIEYIETPPLKDE